ncbi:MAG TPA: protease modulator HflK [Isosphaeraceae bacterium]
MIARRAAWALVAVGLAGYLASGLTVIQQDEVGVVRRFGAVLPEPWAPGLHWGLPRGLDRVDRVARERARTVMVGAQGPDAAPLSRSPDPVADDFLTGDLNLVAAQAQIQFRVIRPVDYLFASRSADAAIEALGESALASALAGREIDDALGPGRAEVAERMRREVQAGADAEGLGISVRAVRLTRVAPPALVAPAFADAARARSDRRQAVTRAEEYRDRALADARGLARETADRAAARQDLLVQMARGEADRFARLTAEVSKSPRSARQRLYLEALAELLPKLSRKVIVAPGRDVDLSVVGGK